MDASRNVRFLVQFFVFVTLSGCRSPEAHQNVPRNEDTAPQRTYSIRGTPYVQLSTSPSMMKPRALLFVDASCPFSMNELLRVLVGDNGISDDIGIVYVPQERRDQGAGVETAALECARQSGAFLPYVKSRNNMMSFNRRPIMESVVTAGITDTLSFQVCVTSSNTQALLRLHASAAERIGVSLLPVLSTGDSSWVGAQVGKRLSQSRF